MPYVEVRLWHGARSVRLVGLVDSGAEMSLLDAQYADLLGLDRATADVSLAVGAGGHDLTVLRWPAAPLELQFENDRFPFLGSFVEFSAGGDGVNLLGRRDFFSRYIVQFWDAAELLSIDVSPDYPRAATP